MPLDPQLAASLDRYEYDLDPTNQRCGACGGTNKYPYRRPTKDQMWHLEGSDCHEPGVEGNCHPCKDKFHAA